MATDYIGYAPDPGQTFPAAVAEAVTRYTARFGQPPTILRLRGPLQSGQQRGYLTADAIEAIAGRVHTPDHPFPAAVRAPGQPWPTLVECGPDGPPKGVIALVIPETRP